MCDGRCHRCLKALGATLFAACWLAIPTSPYYLLGVLHSGAGLVTVFLLIELLCPGLSRR